MGAEKWVLKKLKTRYDSCYVSHIDLHDLTQGIVTAMWESAEKLLLKHEQGSTLNLWVLAQHTPQSVFAVSDYFDGCRGTLQQPDR